jgi:molybdenum-dependent DNA-binding transcriptional regulator ModE
MPALKEVGLSYHIAWHRLMALNQLAERIIAELNNREESDHPSQT